MTLSDEDFAMFKRFKVSSMGERAREICLDSSYDSLTFEEKLKLMIDAEAEARASRKVDGLVSEAGFRTPGACPEEVLYLDGRKLDRGRVERCAGCGWVDDHHPVVIIGKTGCGKSYIAQALGVAACRKGHHVLYKRLHDMLDEIARLRQEGGAAYYEGVTRLKTVEVLIIDDFLTTPITEQGAADLSHVIDAREDRAATLVASLLEPEDWYSRLGDELVADTTLSRLSSAAEFLYIDGPNMREHLTRQRRGEARG